VVATLWTLVRLARAVTPARGDLWAVAVGLTCGAAVLFHLTLVLLAVGLLALIVRWSPPERWPRRVLLAAAAGAVVAVIPLVLALWSEGHTTWGAAWTWLRSADHGLPYPHSWRTPLVVVWGFIRSLIYAPYPHDASLTRVVGLTAAGLVGWGVLFGLRRRVPATSGVTGAHAAPVRPFTHTLRGGSPDGLFVVLWAAPLVLFAATFFPSDTERWIFVMPAVALYLAPAAGRGATVVLLLTVLVNGAVYQLPAAIDRTPLRRAAAVDAHLRPNDLLVYPGHSWDELIGMRLPRPTARATPRNAERLCFIYYVGAERSLQLAVARTRRAIDRAFARGGRAFVARLHDDHDDQGFKEMGWFGLSRQGFAAIFAPYAPRATGVPGLWALSAPVTSTAR
jgi:hypothetical protein